MYELNRIRLVAAGPRGARYTDVMLDLSDVGAVVPTQASLFSEPVRRPSPYSLLLLENGGGKSVLLKLLFSVVLPGKRNTVGGSSGVMDKFVVGDDAAHVVLEWMSVRTGDRVITAKTLQRRRNATSSGERLVEHWWSLRPHEALSVDTLPFTRDGRRLRLDGFREALNEINQLAPVTQLNWVGPEVGEWSRHLRDVGIEPDLFSIQRHMNADEGDAAAAFTFSSSKDFVDWLLRIVLDPEDAISVADNFDSYATTVGDRNAMLIERRFVAGAVDALRPAAAAWSRASIARAARRTTEQRAGTLRQQVRARVRVETEDRKSLEARAVTATAAASTRESERDRARDVANEIRRQTLARSLADVEAERDQAVAGRDDADAQLRAWAVADLLERRAASEADARQLAATLTEAENAAVPALQARDAAAGDLLAKLDAEAAAARAEQSAHEQAAKRLNTDAAEADAERTRQLRLAEQLAGQRRAIEHTMQEARDAVEAAVASGLLSAGQDATQAALDAAAAAVTAEAELAAGEAASHRAEDALVRAGTATRTAHQTLGEARSAHRASSRALEQVFDQAVRLVTAEPVLAALSAEALTVDDLDACAESLAGLLYDQEGNRNRELAQLAAAQTENQRLLDALGDGGLLPARAAVEDSLDVLASAGIAAHAGWRYLAENVTADERAGLVEQHPDLVDGVVLVDADAIPAARAALGAARLLPSAAVAVTSGGRLLAGRSTAEQVPPSDHSIPPRFVIEPSPAMFDTDAAEQRRLELRADMATRGQELDTAEQVLTGLREVRAELAVWRRTCPPGRLTELNKAVEATAMALETADLAHTAAARTAEQAAEERGRQAETVARLRTRERASAELAGELRRLAAQVSSTDEQRQQMPQLEDAIAVAERRIGDLETRRERSRDRATEEGLLAQSCRDRAVGHVTEMRDVVTSSGARADVVPSVGVSALRGVYEATLRTYAAVEVGRDLRDAADRADQDAARLRAEVIGHDEEVVARGERQLGSADGADFVTRSAAVARAERDRQALEAAHREALTRAGTVASELKAATPSDDRNVWVLLTDELRPTSVEHGYNLYADATARQRAAQSRLDEAGRESARLREATERALIAVRDFRAVLDPLAAALSYAGMTDSDADPNGSAPFAGDAEQASDDARAAHGELLQVTREDADAAAEVRRCVDVARDFAGQPEFEMMANVARRALIGLERDSVAARAEEFATQLQQRLATLDTDLESATRHRKLIVDRLSALVDGALKTLRIAARLSKLPPGLGDWEGKEFLRIRFGEPDPSLLAARVGEVVDELAAAVSARSARGTAPRRDGLALLLRSVDAAVPKGFLVDVLKPDAVLRDERVPVEEMNDVFSGGQELTAAIVLYCTLAALRANGRGQMRSRHSGVLFLDNPIGKASARYLLELQQGMAAALGVQLVYTTGLSDDGALSAFPLWVRLRNDADLRAGLKHIRVAQTVRRQLPEPFTEDEAGLDERAPGTVTSTRVYRKPA